MAKYFTIFLIIALLLAGYLTYHFSQDPSSLVPIPEEETDVSLEVYEFQNWHEFESTNGDFSVLLPNLPQHATENITDKSTGKKRKYDMYVSEKPNGTIFMISLITFDDLESQFSKDQLMRTMMNDMVESNPANELHTVEKGTFQGHEALDFTLGNEEMKIDAKTFVIGDTLYVLSRIVKTENYNTNEYNFFINSFELEPQNQQPEEERRQ